MRAARRVYMLCQRLLKDGCAACCRRFDATTDSRKGVEIKSLLMVPVRSRKGHTAAIIEALNCTRPGGFIAEDETVLTVLAGW